MRYGTVPAEIATARQAPPHRVVITADVFMTGVVNKILSSTHSDLTATSEDSQSASWHARYTSPDFLSRDFVLSVVAEGLDAPRCVAQRTEEGHVAMQLALVPKFKLPPIPAQEYIFLVDRSSSMGGTRIETAKRGLMMLLRSLPAQGTTFNIFSFGNHCSGLWPQSMEYNEHTLGLATQHVDSMSANFGGTEIRSALEQTFRSRQHVVPTACFVLTDGESWDTQQTIDSVSLATRSASPEAPLRVFTLGIGNTTSTELCEGISRAGNGICLMAVGSESIIGKCAKLVRAGRTYILRNVKIDWGIDNPNPNVVRQGPAQVDAIYPGNRLLVFNLIESKDIRIPKEVVISAQRDGEGELLRFAVPVQQVHDMSAGMSRHGIRLIHVLAARRIITDLEDTSKANVSPDAKALITRLGIEYQLANRFTSFIAVDKRDNRPLTEQSEPSGTSADLFDPRKIPASGLALLMFGSMPGAARSRWFGDRVEDEDSDDDMGMLLVDEGWDEFNAQPFGVPSSPDDRVANLVRLQLFDGSFAASKNLGLIVGTEHLGQAAAQGVDEKVWATALAVAYLKLYMKGQPELLDGLVEKAVAFLEGAVDDVDEVLEHAGRLVGFP